MKFRFAFFIALLSWCGSLSAQDSTEHLSFTGKLVSVGAGVLEIAVTENDGSVSLHDVAMTAETLIDGCAPDSVQRGTRTFVMLSGENVTPKRASYVQFDGCTPYTPVLGYLRGWTATSVDVETSVPTDFGPVGTRLLVGLRSGTMLYACNGRNRDMSKFSVGDTVYVHVGGDTTSPYVIYMQSQSDCPQHLSADVQFLSASGSRMRFLHSTTNDTLDLTLDPRYFADRDPLDSTVAFTSCDGTIIPLDSLVPGVTMNIAYAIIPDEGSFLQYGYVKEKCPVHLRAKVTAVSGTTITAIGSAETYTLVLTTDSEIRGCKEGGVTRDDIIPGSHIDVQAISTSGSLTVTMLTLLENCPYAFTQSGTVKSASGSSVIVETVDHMTGEPLELLLNIDTETRVADCSMYPMTSADIEAGSTVVTYFRMNNGARIADLIIVVSPCNTASISGIIASVVGQTVIVNSDRGETRSYGITASSRLVNCRGEEFVVTGAAQGARIEGLSSNTGGTDEIRSANVYVDCLQISNISGMVEASSDSTVTLMSAQGSRLLRRGDNSIILDGQRMLVAWGDLFVGRSVCAYVDDREDVLLFAYADAVCDSIGREDESAMVIGRLEEIGDGHVAVSTGHGPLSFAVTPATMMMDEKRNEMHTNDLTRGMNVRVMAKSVNAARMPIAMSVIAGGRSVTTVDEPAASSELSIVPNPASGLVSFTSSHVYDTITLTNVLGSTVAVVHGTTFDTSALPTGVYFVSAQRGTQRTTVKLHIER